MTEALISWGLVLVLWVLLVWCFVERIPRNGFWLVVSALGGLVAFNGFILWQDNSSLLTIMISVLLIVLLGMRIVTSARRKH